MAITTEHMNIRTRDRAPLISLISRQLFDVNKTSQDPQITPERQVLAIFSLHYYLLLLLGCSCLERTGWNLIENCGEIIDGTKVRTARFSSPFSVVNCSWYSGSLAASKSETPTVVNWLQALEWVFFLEFPWFFGGPKLTTQFSLRFSKSILCRTFKNVDSPPEFIPQRLNCFRPQSRL